jgi:hypothetical protein
MNTTEFKVMKQNKLNIFLTISAAGLSLWGCPDGDPPSTMMGGVDDQPDMRMSIRFDYGGVEAGVMAGVTAGEVAGVMAGVTAGVEVQIEESCQPCEDDGDCRDGASCVDMGDEEGGRCFVLCGIEDGAGDETGCEMGVACTTLSDDVSVCVPEDPELCEPFCYDLDSDGYGVGEGCPQEGRDCAPDDASVYPSASDLCDGLDNDCDGNSDEDFMPETCGVGLCGATSACVEGQLMECVPSAPAMEDLTCDGLDDDCDGSADEDYIAVGCGAGLCAAESACVEGAEQSCMPLEPETLDDLSCDGVDEDCDGAIDEDFSNSCGFGLCRAFAVCAGGAESCEPGLADPLELDGLCDGIDSDCDGSADEGFDTTSVAGCGLGVCARESSCEGGQTVCTPGAPLAATDETCDGVDDDCDGEIDEDCQVNTMGASYNEEESVGGLVAFDIYYLQEHSPTNNGVEWQPTTVNVAINFPAGMSPRQPFNEGGAYVIGAASSAANKLVTARQTATVPNQMQYLISTTVIGDDVTPIAPAGEANPEAGLLLRVYFETNGVPLPWSFSWDELRTNMAPERAQGAIEFAPIEIINP